MNSLQIECFMETAKTLNFTKAAEHLFISQPAISKHIRNLETELGYPLFDRSSKGLSLTYGGELFEEFIRKSEADLSENYKKIKNHEQKNKSSVNIGIFPNTDISDKLAEISGEIMQNNPGISISIFACKFGEMESLLENKTVDLIVTLEDFAPNISLFEHFSLPDIQKVIAYRYDIFKNSDQPQTPYDFRDKVFLAANNDESPHIIPKVISYCEKYGFLPQIKPVPNVESMILGVQNGDGVVIIDPSVQWKKPDLIRYIPIEPSHKVLILKRKNETNPYISDLIEKIIEQITKDGYAVS